MREFMLDDVSDFTIMIGDEPWRAAKRQFKSATADSGVPFPTAAKIAAENWGTWQDALYEQIANASAEQVYQYWSQYVGPEVATDPNECPVCSYE